MQLPPSAISGLRRVETTAEQQNVKPSQLELAVEALRQNANLGAAYNAGMLQPKGHKQGSRGGYLPQLAKLAPGSRVILSPAGLERLAA